MVLSAISGTALSGLQAQASRLSAIAGNVAHAGSGNSQRLDTDFSPSGKGGVQAHIRPEAEAGIDLAAEMQGLSEAELAYRANAAVLDAGADLWDVLRLIRRD
ncbi:MAG: flagellar basal body rod protein [Rhizobiaceae bacterium]|nr:flagellar basal body rod protein [Rhizobiaceae bacterium]